MRHRRRSPHAGRRLFLGIATAFWLGCGGGAELTAPTTGGIEVTTSTVGPEPDADGYTLTLDDVEVGPIGVEAARTLIDLTPGTHRLGLAGLSPNCAVQGDNPRAVVVRAGEMAAEPIAVLCTEAPPPSGTLTVTTVTSGSSPDADGYVFTVGGGPGQPIGVSATAVVAGVEAGPTTVELSGVAGSCTVGGANPRAVTVPANATVGVEFAITCAAGTGTLEVTTSSTGSPEDPSGYTVSVDGATPLAIAVNATRTVGGLAPGPHSVALGDVAPNCTLQGSNPRNVDIAASQTSKLGFSIACAATTGSLRVTVAGLPTGVDATVTVTGPQGYREELTAAATLANLAPGQYTVTAARVVSGGTAYTATPPSRTVAVAAGDTAEVVVTYAPSAAASLNLRIAGVSLTQSVQTFDNAVPLVAGRDALLRVVVLANERNRVTPQVRVRLLDGGALVQAYTISPPADTVPTGRSDGDLGTTWNQLIPASYIRSGLTLVADVDPSGTIPEADETDNTYPAGTPLALRVRRSPPLAITLVPVRQSANQLTGDVTTANRDQYLDFTGRLYPLPGYDADVHQVYTTTTDSPLQSDNANGAWNTVLSELSLLKLAEDSERHYYGVVRIDYASGLAGMGFLGEPVAIGYDHPTDRGRVTAHELGHTWDRRHAQCGNPEGVDPDFPYDNGTIGRIGYDLKAGLAKPRTTPDVMGYCAGPWISDYTYQGVMDFRGTAPGRAAAGRAQPSLLVWGRIVGGRAVLEPAFHVMTRPVLPRRRGLYSIEGTASDGSRVFGLTFDAIEVADDARGGRHFAFAVPLDGASAARLQTIRLAGPGVGMAAISATPASLRASPATPLSLRRAAGGIAIEWDAAAQPMVMVRDARSGEVLSFARGGSVVVAGGSAVELVMSDGVRSSSAVVAAPR